jgi:hypothetical protein
MPPTNATVEETAEYERAFNELARYRFERLSTPDADGTTGWMCPFHAGRLRTRAVPETMRASRDAPLIDLPDGERCCDGTVSVQAAELPTGSASCRVRPLGAPPTAVVRWSRVPTAC